MDLLESFIIESKDASFLLFFSIISSKTRM